MDDFISTEWNRITASLAGYVPRTLYVAASFPIQCYQPWEVKTPPACPVAFRRSGCVVDPLPVLMCPESGGSYKFSLDLETASYNSNMHDRTVIRTYARAPEARSSLVIHLQLVRCIVAMSGTITGTRC